MEARALRARAETEGASPTRAFAETLEFEHHGWLRRSVRVTVGPATHARRNLGRLLAGSRGPSRSATIAAQGRELMIALGDRAGWTGSGTKLTMMLTPAVLSELEHFLEGEAREFESAGLPGFHLVLRD